MNERRAPPTILLRLALLALLVLGSGCSLLSGPRDLVLPLPRLQQELEKHFPYDNRYLALFDVTLSEPRLVLHPDSGRVEVQLAARIVPVLGNQPTYGSLAVSGSLRIDPAQRALVLAQPRIERFVLDGVDDYYAAQLGRIGALLLQQMLAELPLYRLEAGDFRHLGVDFTPVGIAVRPNALVLTFEPVK